jgi:hypothetical protein
MRLDLAHDVASMDLYGVFAHAELVGDDLIGFTLAQSVEDLDSQAGKKGKSRFAVLFGIAGWRRKRGCFSHAPGTNPASRDSLAPETPGQGQRGLSNFRRSAQTQRKKALRPRQTSGRPGGLFWVAGLQARHLGNVAWAGCRRAGFEDLPPDCAFTPPRIQLQQTILVSRNCPVPNLKQPRLPAGRSGNGAYFDRWLWHSYHLSDNEPKESRRAAACQTGRSITFRSMRLDRHSVLRT